MAGESESNPATWLTIECSRFVPAKSHCRSSSSYTLDINLTPAKAGYTADILSILVLGFSKVSTCLFYEGLFSQTQLRLSRSILLGVIIWMIMSVVLLAVRCTHDPWADISATQCGSLVRCDFRLEAPRARTLTAPNSVSTVAGHYRDRHRHGVLPFPLFRTGRAKSQDLEAQKIHGVHRIGESNTVRNYLSNQNEFHINNRL